MNRLTLLSLLLALGALSACEKKTPASPTPPPLTQAGALTQEDGEQEEDAAPTASLEQGKREGSVYLANFERDLIAVTLHDLSDEERLGLLPKGADLAENVEFSPSDKRIPMRYRAAKAYDILLPDSARLSAKLKGFRIAQSASEGYLEALLTLPKGQENNAYGIARAAGSMGAEASVSIAEPLELTPEQLGAALPPLRQALHEKMFRDMRALLPESIDPEHLQIFAAAFPGKHRYLGVVDIPVKGRGPDERISSLFLLDKELALTTFVEPPNVDAVSYEPRFFFTTSGPEAMQCFYESQADVGSAQHALSFDSDGLPHVTILSSDDA